MAMRGIEARNRLSTRILSVNSAAETNTTKAMASMPADDRGPPSVEGLLSKSANAKVKAAITKTIFQGNFLFVWIPASAGDGAMAEKLLYAQATEKKGSNEVRISICGEATALRKKTRTHPTISEAEKYKMTR